MVADGVDAATVAVIYRSSLAVQRPRIQHFFVDVTSDEPWPAEVP